MGACDMQLGVEPVDFEGDCAVISRARPAQPPFVGTGLHGA